MLGELLRASVAEGARGGEGGGGSGGGSGEQSSAPGVSGGGGSGGGGSGDPRRACAIQGHCTLGALEAAAPPALLAALGGLRLRVLFAVAAIAPRRERRGRG